MWVLILIVFAGIESNVAITKVEGFTSVESCRKAAAHMVKNVDEVNAQCILVE